MPIFMDRHDIPGLTAMDVAEGHKQDLRIQHEYDCRALTYWFDEKRGTAFCLIEAPNKKAVRNLHDAAHGLIPQQIIEVDGHLVEAFLGRIEDPQTFDKVDDSDLFIFNDPAFRTIMVAELKNTAFIRAKYGTIKGSELCSIYNESIQKAVRRFGGLEVEHAGKDFIATFASATNSVECAIEIQNNFKDHNSQKSGAEVQVAIGLAAGQPVTERADFFGEVKQTAKRASYIANGGQNVLSSTVTEYYKTEKLGLLSKDNIIRTLSLREETFLNRLMDAIEKSWNREEFNVSDLSKQIGLSKSQLYRKIVSLTGQSPNEFIKEFRLSRALKMLESRQGNISEIAFESGFSNPSYFSQCFLQKFGLRPSEYEAATTLP